MKLSIVTINYNDKSGLHKTMESVVNQTYPDIEYIVIDGGSTDGSVDVIKQYETKIAYWISERDKGIYNAMNKGLKQATGDYCLFLNSGDFLYSNDIISKLFEYEFSEDIVSAGVTNFNEKEEWYKYPPTDISLYTFIGGSLPHPSSLIKTSFIKSLGGYNEEYKIISDWCFFIDATIVHNCSYRAINLFLTRFNCFGISSTLGSQENEKRIEFLKNRFPRIFKDYQVLENEPFVNVLFYIRSKKFLYNNHFLAYLASFPFRIVNHFLKLRFRLGKRMRLL